MPAITLRLPSKLSTSTKRMLVEAYTAAACRVFNCPPKAVYVHIEEVAPENWCTPLPSPTR